MNTKTVCQNAGGLFRQNAISGKHQAAAGLKTAPSGGAGSAGGKWLVGALAMVAAFTFCQRASAIDPYPGEGNPGGSLERSAELDQPGNDHTGSNAAGIAADIAGWLL